MQFETLVDVYNDAIYYQNANNRYKGEFGQVFCDVCNKCPITRCYSSSNIDMCVKCYNKISRNMNVWKMHLKKGKKELDDVIMLCIEQQCDITNLDDKGFLLLGEHQCTSDPNMTIISCDHCEAIFNYNKAITDLASKNDKKKVQTDNYVDAWYRPQYNESSINPPSLGENTRLTMEKDDDMEDVEDDEMADFKEHANTRRARFIPDDSY